MIQIKICVIHITNITLHFTKRFEIQDCNFVLVEGDLKNRQMQKYNLVFYS